MEGEGIQYCDVYVISLYLWAAEAPSLAEVPTLEGG